MFRQILSNKLSNAQKKTLRDFYNANTGNNQPTISKIARQMKLNNGNEAYEYLRELYNEDIEEKQTKNKKEKQKQKRLTAQKVLENTKVYNPFEYQHDDRLQKFYNLLKNIFLNKTIVLDYVVFGKHYKDVRVEVPDIKEFSKWWNKTGRWLIYTTSGVFIWDDEEIISMYESDDDDMTFKIIIYEANTNFNYKKIKQFFKEGETNCLLTPILNWATNLLENSKTEKTKSRYKTIIKKINTKLIPQLFNTGVPQDNTLNDIANDLQIDLNIIKPLCDIKFINIKSNKKCLKAFTFLNNKLNHVEIMNTSIDNYVLKNNIIEITQEDLQKLKIDLDTNETHYTFEKGLDNIRSISTLEATYTVKDDFNEKMTEFEIDTGLINCKIDDIDDKELSLFIKNGTHYNGTIDFIDVSKITNKEVNDKNKLIYADYKGNKINHIDMITAYANYLKCDYYEGFLGKITDFRKTDKIMGVGLYQIYDLNFDNNIGLKEYNNIMKIYFNDTIYPSCELRFLLNQKVTFKISYGCWGINALDFDLLDYDCMKEKYDGIKGYSKYTGKCDSHYLSKKYWINGDENMASLIRDNTTGKVEKYENNTICVSYNKQHNYHLGHFTSFIVAYQRIQVLEQLLCMNEEDIIRVCVDGIYSTEENISYDEDIFQPKDILTFENTCATEYISRSDIKNDWECGEFRDTFKKELFIGAGGNGKTHLNLTDKGLIKVLYCSPSWKLATKKANEYNCKSQVWSNLLTLDPEQQSKIKRFNTLLIDEVSMMTEEQKNTIFSTYSELKLIFCGDIGFQAKPFNTDANVVINEITDNDFDNVIKLNKNYRFKCDKLIHLINDVREFIEYNRSDKEINNFVKKYFINNTITDNEVKQLYKIEDMILSRSHNIKDNYTEMFKDMEKYSITKNSRFFKNGDIIIGEKPDADCEIRHSYTIHSIQGETCYTKLFINVDKEYDGRLLYTALSRATKLEQIYLVKKENVV